MPTEADPIVGNWYQHLDKGQEFQVIDVDEAAGIVETQHFDGDIEEIPLDEWYELDLEPIEAPEDWTGPMDEIEADDLGYSDTAMQPDDWTEPLEEIHTEAAEAAGETPEESEESGQTLEAWEETAPEGEPGIEIEPYRE